MQVLVGEELRLIALATTVTDLLLLSLKNIIAVGETAMVRIITNMIIITAPSSLPAVSILIFIASCVYPHLHCHLCLPSSSLPAVSILIFIASCVYPHLHCQLCLPLSSLSAVSTLIFIVICIYPHLHCHMCLSPSSSS